MSIASLPLTASGLGVGILNAVDELAGGGARLAGRGARSFRSLDKAVEAITKERFESLPEKVYHYTRSEVASLIEKQGLLSRTGIIYSTTDPTLSPLQAQIDLALPPNRGLPDALFEINLVALLREGIQITGPRRVGRWYNMPGGGIEILIHTTRIAPRYIRRVK